MKVTRLYVLGLGLVGLAFCAAAANAQQYKWKDSRGHTVYGDVPPPGVEATPVKSVMATPIAPAGTQAGAKAGAKGTKVLTPAEKEMEFRRRVKEAQEAAAKQAKEDQANRESQQNCENAREQERTLASGQRVSRVDEKGERYYVDDAQRAQELSQARRSISEWCK